MEGQKMRIVLLLSALALFVLLFNTPLHVEAQNAKVMALSTDDAAQAKKLHVEMKAAEKAWEDFNKKVKKEYASKDSGFEYGFTFSEDFKYIVPDASATWTTATGTITITPNCCGAQTYWYPSCGTTCCCGSTAGTCGCGGITYH
jgi:hypothetical protein